MAVSAEVIVDKRPFNLSPHPETGTAELYVSSLSEHAIGVERPLFENLLYDPALRAVSDIYSHALPRIIVPNPRIPVRNPLLGEWQILASGETGQISNEFYTTPFGRDFAITLIGLAEAVEHGASEIIPYLQRGMIALEELESYQAEEDDPKRGVKKGQIPHELRFATDPRFKFFEESNWPMTTRINVQGKGEKIMVNYDSSEATQLYVLLVMKLDQLYPGFAKQRQDRIDAACEYMVKNSSEHDGLAGFINDLPWDVLEQRFDAYAGLPHKGDTTYPNHQRTTGGLGWREIRDSDKHTFTNGLLIKPGEPIDGLQTTAIKFAAELEAADYYEKMGRSEFAEILRSDARETKKKTNSTAGFLQYDEQGRIHFVEAIGVNPETNIREPLPYITSSPLYALAYSYTRKDQFGNPLRDSSGRVKRESVIDDKYLEGVVDRLITDLYDSEGGLTTYASSQVIPPPRGESQDGYWIHMPEEKTFWGPEQNLAAKGCLDFGFIDEGLLLGVTGSRVIANFGTSLENWIKKQGHITHWELPGEDPDKVQSSGKIQAFTMGPGLAFIAQVNALRAELAAHHQPEHQLVGQSLYLPA